MGKHKWLVHIQWSTHTHTDVHTYILYENSYLKVTAIKKCINYLWIHKKIHIHAYNTCIHMYRSFLEFLIAVKTFGFSMLLNNYFDIGWSIASITGIGNCNGAKSDKILECFSKSKCNSKWLEYWHSTMQKNVMVMV